MRRNGWITLLSLLAVTTITILVIALSKDATILTIGSFVGVLWWILLVLTVGLGYLQLAILVGRAAERKGRSSTSWTLIAFFFGLIIPAIIVAVMGPIDGPTGRVCPYCAEQIQPAALKCKHCGESLEVAVSE